MNGSARDGIDARGTRLLPWGGAVALLSLPALAMRLGVAGVDWSAADFIVFGAMLLAACGLYELARRARRDIGYRAAAAIAIATAFLATWANLAVGMAGSEADPLNLAFAGVPGVGLVGAVLAGSQAPGLAKAMLAAGCAQALVAAAAFAIGADPRGAAFSALFVAPWLLSSLLFRRASH